MLGNIQVWRHQEVPATGLGKYDTWWCQCWVGVGGQAKYDMMMVFCGNALHRQHSHQALDPRLHITDKLVWLSKFTTSDQLTKTVIEAALLYISFANTDWRDIWWHGTIMTPTQTAWAWACGKSMMLIDEGQCLHYLATVFSWFHGVI